MNHGSEGIDSAPRRRVLFLCAELDNGGAERHWAALLPALSARQVGVRLVGIKGGGRAFEELGRLGVPTREFGRTGLRSFAALPALLQESRAEPQAVVTFGYNAHAVGALFSRISGTPQIVNWHRQQGWPMSSLERNAVQLAARSGAGAIAVTEAQVPDLTRLGFPAGRIRVVHNGVEGPRQKEGGISPSSIRAGLDGDQPKFVAILVARLRPEKRITDFIDAVCLANRQVPNLLGVVVGDGPMAEELEAHATSRDAPVRFVGHQPDPATWMLAADVVCLTSSFEALPISLVEGISCGRPCIATDVGGTREIVEPGVNGELVPPEDVRSAADALVRLAGDPGMREAMGNSSLRRWREGFSFEEMVDRYVQLLTSVTGPPASWADYAHGP